MSGSVLIVAGEVSGDLHAGNMLGELHQMQPGIEVFGIGGDRLREYGLDCLATTDELAHMGLIEVLRELPRIRAVMNRVVEETARRRPHLAVLVDSPDFNLRLADRLHNLGIPVILYVSPQLWAWRRGRVETVRRLAREVLCLLPFEVSFYADHGVRARYVGHPLVDDVARDGLLEHDLDATPRKIALLPGSRSMEVKALLPTMIRAVRHLSGIEPVIIEAPGIGGVLDEVLGEEDGPPLRRVAGRERRHELATSSIAWTASGTATLECALLDVPMVVGYRLQPLSYLIAKLLVRVPHVALVNLIGESRIAPELIQKAWSPSGLANVTQQQLADGSKRQREGLALVRRRLGAPGASRRAAEAVLEHL